MPSCTSLRLVSQLALSCRAASRMLTATKGNQFRVGSGHPALLTALSPLYRRPGPPELGKGHGEAPGAQACVTVQDTWRDQASRLGGARESMDSIVMLGLWLFACNFPETKCSQSPHYCTAMPSGYGRYRQGEKDRTQARASLVRADQNLFWKKEKSDADTNATLISVLYWRWY
ncbi:hypothetical protein BKA65DRAFT_217751 [Rhexocercosporidium sp. MPI-PUGE-AT-0058]|nr:hypothetical protein BKA65DRAFT_217751 [Rhexocercosporidium sp. MPI-PUGE-AT-0058]